KKDLKDFLSGLFCFRFTSQPHNRHSVLPTIRKPYPHFQPDLSFSD
ncbi:hypothetical protein PRABACTJOHN_02128, partial [Parabacteroides johnsonii DSM 18315]